MCSGFSANKVPLILKVFRERDSRRQSPCPLGYLVIRTFLPLMRAGEGVTGRDKGRGRGYRENSRVASVPSCGPQPQDLQEGDVDFAENGIS